MKSATEEDITSFCWPFPSGVSPDGKLQQKKSAGVDSSPSITGAMGDWSERSNKEEFNTTSGRLQEQTKHWLQIWRFPRRTAIKTHSHVLMTEVSSEGIF